MQAPVHLTKEDRINPAEKGKGMPPGPHALPTPVLPFVQQVVRRPVLGGRQAAARLHLDSAQEVTHSSGSFPQISPLVMKSQPVENRVVS